MMHLKSPSLDKHENITFPQLPLRTVTKKNDINGDYLYLLANPNAVIEHRSSWAGSNKAPRIAAYSIIVTSDIMFILQQNKICLQRCCMRHLSKYINMNRIS